MITGLKIRFPLIPRLVRRVSRPHRRLRARQTLAHQSAFAGVLLERLAQEGQLDPVGRTLSIASTVLTRSDVVVAMLADRATGQVRATLKLPLTPDAEWSLARHRHVIMTLHDLPELRPFCSLVPKAIAWGSHAGHPYFVETALQGRPASDLVDQIGLLSDVQQSAARALLLLHTATARRSVIDEATFQRLAGADLQWLTQLAGSWPSSALLLRKLEQLERLLRDRLLGRELPLAWIHGDFWLGNLLVQGPREPLTGVIDWDRAAPQEIPLHDVFHLLVYTRKLVRNSEPGEEVVDYLLPAAFGRQERTLVDTAIAALDLPDSADFLSAMALLYWLRGAAVNLTRYPAFRTDGKWLSKNAFLVLKRGIT